MRVPTPLVLLVLAACGDELPTQTRNDVDPRFSALLEVARADLEASNGTAASVAIWWNEEVTWIGGLGTVDPFGERAPGADTLFMIGSDTKKMTAVSLLRRVAEGKASLETTVAEVLPELDMPYAPDYPRATLRHLLSMQGGIVDGGDDSTSTTDAALETYAFGEFASSFYQMAPPGVLYNYSNPNYAIAGLIDQRLDGRMWADIVTQDLFAPLGMKRTFARRSEVDEDYAFGIDPESGEVVQLGRLWEAAFMRPAGLVWSTPSDQMRLAGFLVDGDERVLPPALHAELVSGQVVEYPDFESRYGFGLSISRGVQIGDDYYDVPVWSHGGDTLTHSSMFYVLPEQRFAISVLCNASACDFSSTLGAAIAGLLDLPAPSAAPEAPFDATALDALTGTYVDEYNVGTLVIARSGDVLTVDAPTLEAYDLTYEPALVPLSTHLWLWTLDGYDYDVAFIDGPSGEVYLRNRDFVAIKQAP